MNSSDVAELTLMSSGDIFLLYTDGVYDGSDKQERQQLEGVMREHYPEPAKEICNASLDYAVKKDQPRPCRGPNPKTGPGPWLPTGRCLMNSLPVPQEAGALRHNKSAVFPIDCLLVWVGVHRLRGGFPNRRLDKNTYGWRLSTKGPSLGSNRSPTIRHGTESPNAPTCQAGEPQHDCCALSYL